MSLSRKPYRDGFVHVMEGMCPTCIFRPGNLMHLADGRRDEMVEKATKNDGAIICHETLDGKKAVCYGFFKYHPTSPLQIADRLKKIQFVKSAG